MRVDVYLKQTRLIKRRSLAKELCEEGAVSINGQRVRAGREVSPGDTLELNLRNRRLAVEIVDIPSLPPSTPHASDFYRIITDEMTK
ncbi:MAG: RNA-binding S4 domain-containing protein [Acidobacteriota bacterium]|nr:MAG: RNA-binding S4 domain-containing protein [Acidobacteriota bacterium]